MSPAFTSFLKALLVPCLAAVPLWYSSGSELAVQIGTIVLTLVAAGVVCFYTRRKVQAKAALYLCLVPTVQHGTDYYFWAGVQHYPLPWPWESAHGLMGSITPFVIQVADTSFAILAFVAICLVGWHLSRRRNRLQAPDGVPPELPIP